MRTKYEVAPGKDKWGVYRNGVTMMKGNNYALFNRKKDAIDFARRKASNDSYSKLIIKDMTGKIMKTHRY